MKHLNLQNKQSTKATFLVAMLFVAFLFNNSFAQNTKTTTTTTVTTTNGPRSSSKSSSSSFGGALNIGVGIGGYYNRGYYGYIGRSLPVFNINYELDVAKNFTLAPSISFYSYTNSYYWGNKNNPYRYYNYTETVIPIGVKGTYYFDQVLGAGSKWDFYLGGTLGFAVVNSSWDRDYQGDKNYYRRGDPLFLDLHVGTEYHINSKVGLFLDLSSGVSTLGLAIH